MNISTKERRYICVRNECLSPWQFFSYFNISFHFWPLQMSSRLNSSEKIWHCCSPGNTLAKILPKIGQCVKNGTFIWIEKVIEKQIWNCSKKTILEKRLISSLVSFSQKIREIKARLCRMWSRLRIQLSSLMYVKLFWGKALTEMILYFRIWPNLLVCIVFEERLRRRGKFHFKPTDYILVIWFGSENTVMSNSRIFLLHFFAAFANFVHLTSLNLFVWWNYELVLQFW